MLRTAEMVSPKHPDKICDRIADAILDECLRVDEHTRSAIEVMGGHGIITITGELTTNAYVDIPKIAHRIAGEYIGVQVNIAKQSPEIAHGVDIGGAGDQGIMIGYACDETPDMLPLEYVLARDLNKYIYSFGLFDGKTQVTIDSETRAVTSIVASFEQRPASALESMVIGYVSRNMRTAPDMKLFINPAGDWNVGGFDADTGLTGRKLAVDNYGPRVPIGGGAFSGKDATKVDRSGAYMARKLAVYYLRKSKAHEIMTRLAYSIGVAEPVEVTILADGREIPRTDTFDLRPSAIINELELLEPKFATLASYGHFGVGELWDE